MSLIVTVDDKLPIAIVLDICFKLQLFMQQVSKIAVVAYKISQLQQCIKSCQLQLIVHLKVNNCNNVILIALVAMVHTKVNNWSTA